MAVQILVGVQTVNSPELVIHQFAAACAM